MTELAKSMAAVDAIIAYAGESVEALAKVYRALHDVDRQQRPHRHGHCPTCHPEQDRRPLAVDGHGYHRRQRARQRRRHHGR